MLPGYWGANYFNSNWWRLYYWFENIIGASAAQIVWGYKQSFEKATSKKELEEKLDALEQELQISSDRQVNKLTAITQGLRAKLQEPKPFEEILKQLLSSIELKQRQIEEAQELEDLILLLAME